MPDAQPDGLCLVVAQSQTGEYPSIVPDVSGNYQWAVQCILFFAVFVGKFGIAGKKTVDRKNFLHIILIMTKASRIIRGAFSISLWLSGHMHRKGERCFGIKEQAGGFPAWKLSK